MLALMSEKKETTMGVCVCVCVEYIIHTHKVRKWGTSLSGENYASFE